MDPAEYLDLAHVLADLADGITMARFRAHDLHVEAKPDLTPVSEADLAVEHAVREHLATAAAAHGVLGEEHGTAGADAEYRWIIDPIDGTKGYVRGTPVWATLLALEYRGELVLGLASAPALGRRWWAARGLGAFADGDPISVSGVHTVEDAHFSFAWDANASFERDGLPDRLLALGRRCWRVRSFGDFWHHMLVAEGAVDVSLDPVVALWDFAAVQVIVEEAGGRVTDLAGDPPADGRALLASNGLLHDAFVDALAPPA